MGSCQVGFYFKPKSEFDYSEVCGDPLGVAVSLQRRQGSGIAVSSKQLRLARSFLITGQSSRLPGSSQEVMQTRVQIIGSAPLFIWKHFGVSPQR